MWLQRPLTVCLLVLGIISGSSDAAPPTSSGWHHGQRSRGGPWSDMIDRPVTSLPPSPVIIRVLPPSTYNSPRRGIPRYMNPHGPSSEYVEHGTTFVIDLAQLRVPGRVRADINGDRMVSVPLELPGYGEFAHFDFVVHRSSNDYFTVLIRTGHQLQTIYALLTGGRQLGRLDIEGGLYHVRDPYEVAAGTLPNTAQLVQPVYPSDPSQVAPADRDPRVRDYFHVDSDPATRTATNFARIYRHLAPPTWNGEHVVVSWTMLWNDRPGRPQ